MKKIVNNLLYDTDASTLIHDDKINNRKWYVTANGNYYVFYATGEITPKTEEAVKDYLGSIDVDKYIELFGTPEEA